MSKPFSAHNGSANMHIFKGVMETRGYLDLSCIWDHLKFMIICNNFDVVYVNYKQKFTD